MPTAEALGRLEARLKRDSTAEVAFDLGTRQLYATDASLFQVEPLAVAVPRTVADVAAIVRAAAGAGVAVVPRGGATSLSGQTVGRAVIVDDSKYLNRIGTVDLDKMCVYVEPGVVLDRLNAHLKPLGLMFGPDVSTSDRATIGGMIGNNSAGARSLRYGKTADHVRSLEVVLADGTTATFGDVDADQIDGFSRRDDRLGAIYRAVAEVVQCERDEIIARFPKILRRVSGYNLDELIPDLSIRAQGWPVAPWRLNLSKLIAGSEGTLAVVVGATLGVVPIPPAQGLVVLSFDTVKSALDRVNEILETGPASVEMLDRMILDLAAGNPEMARHLDFAEGRPGAVLAAQYYAESAEELADRAEALARRFEGRPHVLGVRKSLTQAAKDDFWKVRKAGLSLLMGMVGDAKPVAFVEDTAVAVAKLPAFYDRFEAIVARHGLDAACYGHADVGCLHIRPILNVKTEAGVDQLRSIAAEVADLVAEFGGAMSGEHGDGLARSLWNPKLFGPRIDAAFHKIKDAFDPAHTLNPGKVVGRADPGADLRLSPTYHAEEPAETVFDFAGQGGFARAVEMCSGVGACRKPTGGTMCPSYMVTRDEIDSTRGRANALRLVMSGALPAESMDHETLHRAMDLCLSCKACKTECPSNVDMAKLKAETQNLYYRGRPRPLAHLLLANVFRLNRAARLSPRLANWTLRQPAFQWLLEKLAGIDRRRTLPTYADVDFRSWFARHAVDPRAGTRGKVVLLDDCFTTANDPAPGRAAVAVLEAAGYAVELAGLRCCGRAAFSKGMLSMARELAAENVAKLLPFARAGVPIVGVEPSCLLTLVDEYRELRLGPDADLVASKAVLIDTFVADLDRVPDLPLRPMDGEAIVHGHCQQKALVGVEGTVAALGRIPGLKVRAIDSGCCGMAGSFGYERGHYDVSKALAERVLLPAARESPGSILVAPGFSCRSQVHGLAGIDARHPIEVIAGQLK